ncbi:MAG: phosphoribosylformylglycinamidine synthase [Finegoldia magna]|uniref:phosphoribosylformylglycinamidine synthase n=1 Tax=Finegoldia magna TaxID=1260 RepID=UPI0039A03883
MKILVVGSGGREFALGRKIKSFDENRKVFFAPGNAGTESIGENVDIQADDLQGLLEFAKKNQIDFTVVGPENPLCDGISDLFEENGLKIFGPVKKAAEFENSKSFTKKFLEKYDINTAKYLESKDFDESYDFANKLLEENGKVVVKRDGLAAGKGVCIVDNSDDLKEILQDVLEKDNMVVIEQFLDGFEMSLLCFTDSKTILPLPTAKDHKKIFEREMGANTGGMGTYAPNVEAEVFVDRIKKSVLDKILTGLKEENIDFRGLLFIGFMITDDGIYVLEFNARFGDPETQVVLELIDNDLLDIMMKTSEGKLSDVDLKINDNKALCVVVSAGGYPESYDKGDEITFSDMDSVVFHAGTKKVDGKIVTNGGRVLNIVNSKKNFDDVIKACYEDIEKVDFKNMYHRTDIGPRVKRVYVRKKDEYDYESKEKKKQIENLLGIDLDKFVIYKRYDLEISDDNLKKIVDTVLSEKSVDDVFYGEDALKLQADMKNAIAVEYLPGQFDQRKQGVLDTLSLILDEEVDCKTSTVYEIEGANKEDLEKIEKYLVNPVDSHKVNLLGIPTTLKQENPKNLENETYNGFRDMKDDELQKFVDDHSLAMNDEDLKCIRDYFKSEDRDPNETEIKILDTYWSDHCRHTTFNTFLDIEFNAKTKLDEAIHNSFEEYLKVREELNIEKPINLMSFGTILSKYMRSKNEFDDLEISSEINACSVKIKVRVEVDGVDETRDYLLMFKNETHNHPTEIEPFGGASTCLGGAIRDPLSGRAFVYQAMRITGAGNPLTSLEDTMDGKLPQIKITQEAAKGYSSYGNQIGLATGFVDEIYHDGYVAKRLECGAVMAAAPIENVKRIEPEKGDIVILLGGRTGRDGIGGATGSSKSHKVTSIKTESAQVQKGNAPEERKIQRLFRIPELASLIKKCNDFGAGGVSVAIGELHDGVDIYLDRVPLKYKGLKPFEIAISESQERMACVIAKKDLEEFVKYADAENIETTVVADITDTNRMRMFYDEDLIADISYDFINTNGSDRNAEVEVVSEDVPEILTEKCSDANKFYDKVKMLNITSKRDLIEMFDSTIGRNTVINPMGGKLQLNPSQAMVAKIPTMDGVMKTVSMMSYGFDADLSEQSQYLGGYYAVVESISKLIALGSDKNLIRLTFQEYYEKMLDKKIWSKPLKALLGAFTVSKYFKAMPIGGKDSMSGNFEDIKVPPTMISFAVTHEDVDNIITNDLKGKGKIGLVRTPYEEDGTLNLEKLEENFDFITEQIRKKNIISAIALDKKGLLANIFEQSAGNTGFNIKFDNLYNPMYGSFVVEYIEDDENIEHIGDFADEIIVNDVKLDSEKLLEGYTTVLNKVFTPKEKIEYKPIKNKKIEQRRMKSKKPTDTPHVVILAAPGTNCEWDTLNAFKENGADGEIVLFKNRNQEDILNSIDVLAEKIRKAQIFAIPGGFSLGDEPDGSAKFLANILRNEKISSAIDYLLNENDGLVIGICNGFQALVKTGLLPYGKVTSPQEDDPNLTFNTNRRHIATFVDTLCLTNNSPWTNGIDLNKTYRMPISHGEGRFVIKEDKLQELLDNEQVFSAYKISPNGSDYNIEGILSRDGKILGRMCHTERIADDLYKNIYDIDKQNIFRNAVEYFKEK